MKDKQAVVLITGATGFIGGYATRLFYEQGWQVISLSRSDSVEPIRPFLTAHYEGDLAAVDLLALLRRHQPTLCIHCVGSPSVGASMSEPNADFQANVVLTFKMLDALRLHAPGCGLIYLSSAAVYGNPRMLPVSEEHLPAPISPYGFHKLQSEQLCQEFASIYGIPTASVRIFSAYGPGLRRQVVWDICTKAITTGRMDLLGTGSESRDFIHGHDVARALLHIAEKAPLAGEVYNLGTGVEVTIRKLAELIIEALDMEIQPAFSGVVPSGSPLNWCADISRLSALGFSPAVSLEEGIEACVHWCRAELVGA